MRHSGGAIGKQCGNFFSKDNVKNCPICKKQNKKKSNKTGTFEKIILKLQNFGRLN